jgi:uncharacterized membrane protein (UPF0127 family)
MKIHLKYKDKNFEINAKRCGVLGRVRGLMFRSREKAPAILLLDFKKSCKFAIHSMFVFFPFIAIWLDNENKIVEIKKVFPWKFHVVPKKKFCRLIEIPLNQNYKKFEFLVGD